MTGEMGERDTDNSLSGDKAAGQNVIHRKTYFAGCDRRGDKESEGVCLWVGG